MLGSDVELVVRCELDGVMNYKGQDQLLSIKALNEFDPKHTGASTHPSPCPMLANPTATERDKACCMPAKHCTLKDIDGEG